MKISHYHELNRTCDLIKDDVFNMMQPHDVALYLLIIIIIFTYYTFYIIIIYFFLF